MARQDLKRLNRRGNISPRGTAGERICFRRRGRYPFPLKSGADRRTSSLYYLLDKAAKRNCWQDGNGNTSTRDKL